MPPSEQCLCGISGVRQAVGLDFFGSVVSECRAGRLRQREARRVVTSFLEAKAHLRPKRGTGEWPLWPGPQTPLLAGPNAWGIRSEVRHPVLWVCLGQAAHCGAWGQESRVRSRWGWAGLQVRATPTSPRESLHARGYHSGHAA